MPNEIGCGKLRRLCSREIVKFVGIFATTVRAFQQHNNRTLISVWSLLGCCSTDKPASRNLSTNQLLHPIAPFQPCAQVHKTKKAFQKRFKVRPNGNLVCWPRGKGGKQKEFGLEHKKAQTCKNSLFAYKKFDSFYFLKPNPRPNKPQPAQKIPSGETLD
ncbi:hypothetical protein PROFUN_10365 [Planoprotostelium fungivorum]|uniref:Uncharacterized protein n=1 Tax=Planoprotostelium fungivorum TaxID=1890364 RepID=A0A2P6NEB3_9EUKA|nr:hypothetical protein PROFUN_10365 [Planoprotostelium fungivorum]